MNSKECDLKELKRLRGLLDRVPVHLFFDVL